VPVPRTFLRYLGSGSTAAAVHFAVLIGLVEALALDPTPASALGFAAATAVNYTLQYYWVFGSGDDHRRTFARYLAVTLSMLALNVVLFRLILTGLGWWYPLVQAVVTGVVMVLNFLLNRHFTFRAAAPLRKQRSRSATAAESSFGGWGRGG
jgi:putative flippase GtrA